MDVVEQYKSGYEGVELLKFKVQVVTKSELCLMKISIDYECWWVSARKSPERPPEKHRLLHHFEFVRIRRTKTEKNCSTHLHNRNFPKKKSLCFHPTQRMVYFRVISINITVYRA